MVLFNFFKKTRTNNHTQTTAKSIPYSISNLPFYLTEGIDSQLGDTEWIRTGFFKKMKLTDGEAIAFQSDVK